MRRGSALNYSYTIRIVLFMRLGSLMFKNFDERLVKEFLVQKVV